MNQDLDTILDNENEIGIPHLTKENVVVLLATETPEVDANELTYAYFYFKMLKLVKIYNGTDIMDRNIEHSCQQSLL